MRLWSCPLQPLSLNNLPLGGLVLSSIEWYAEQPSHRSPQQLASSEQFNLGTVEIECCAAQRAGIDTLYTSKAHDDQYMTAYWNVSNCVAASVLSFAVCIARKTQTSTKLSSSLPTCECKQQTEQHVRQRCSTVSLFQTHASFRATQLKPSDRKVSTPLNYIASP